jgi:hypothetical protein
LSFANSRPNLLVMRFAARTTWSISVYATCIRVPGTAYK